MHRVLFTIGSLTIYSYGFFIALAILICLILIVRDARKNDMPVDKYMDALIWILGAGIIGGRLLFVIVNWKYFSQHLLSIFAIREGGMAFQGSLFTALLIGIFVAKLKKLPFWRSADFFAPYLALGHAIGRIGCFFNGCCFGKIADKGIQVNFPGETVSRIPIQLYTAGLLFLLFIILLQFRKKEMHDGAVFCLYLIFYGVLRFFVDFFRGDLSPVQWGVTLSQLISAAIAVGGLVFYVFLSGLKQTRRDMPWHVPTCLF